MRAYAMRAFANSRARAPQGTRVGSASNLAMAGSSTSFGVWALSLSACGGLLAAVSSDGRLEVRRQEAKPGGQAAAASCRLVSRGLVQLHEAPRPEAAAAGAESSARAVRVLLGEAAEAPPPPAPDGQAPTPPHLALRVVAFNPNPAHRQWVACAGPSGLLACVRVPSGEPSGKYFTIRATRDRYTRTPSALLGVGQVWVDGVSATPRRPVRHDERRGARAAPPNSFHFIVQVYKKYGLI